VSWTYTETAFPRQDKTAGATQTIVPDSNCIAGAVVILRIAADNAGTSGASVTGSGASVTDTKGNTWTRVSPGALQDPGAANAGVSCDIWYTFQDAGTLQTTDTVTFNFASSTSVTACVLSLGQWVESLATRYTVGSGVANNGASISPQVTTSSAVVGEVVVCAGGAETAGTGGADSDTTNGSWAGNNSSVTSGGAADTNIAFRNQHKEVTGTGTQSWDWSLSGSADWAVMSCILRAFKDLSDTETGTAVDAAGSVALAGDGDTGSGADAASGVAVAGPGDTGSGADAGESIVGSLTDAETGAAVDAGESVNAAAADSDSGAAVDAGESVNAAITDSDSGSAADAGEALAASVAGGDDPATATDAGEALTVLLTDSDAGTAADTGEAVAAAVTDAEAASADDQAGVAAQVGGDDDGTADDEAAINAQLTDADTGSAVDDAAITVQVVDFDVATATDDELVAALLTDFDLGTANDDVYQLLALVTDGDTLTWIEAAVVTVVGGAIDVDRTGPFRSRLRVGPDGSTLAGGAGQSTLGLRKLGDSLSGDAHGSTLRVGPDESELE